MDASLARLGTVLWPWRPGPKDSELGEHRDEHRHVPDVEGRPPTSPAPPLVGTVRPARLAWMAIYRVRPASKSPPSLSSESGKAGPSGCLDTTGNDTGTRLDGNEISSSEPSGDRDRDTNADNSADDDAENDVDNDAGNEGDDESPVDVLFYYREPIELDDGHSLHATASMDQIRAQIGVLRGSADLLMELLRVPSPDAVRNRCSDPCGTSKSLRSVFQNHPYFSVKSAAQRAFTLWLAPRIWMAVAIDVPQWVKPSSSEQGGVRWVHDNSWRPDSWLAQRFSAAWDQWVLLHGQLTPYTPPSVLDGFFAPWAAEFDPYAPSTSNASHTSALFAPASSLDIVLQKSSLPTQDPLVPRIAFAPVLNTIGPLTSSVIQGDERTQETADVRHYTKNGPNCISTLSNTLSALLGSHYVRSGSQKAMHLVSALALDHDTVAFHDMLADLSKQEKSFMTGLLVTYVREKYWLVLTAIDAASADQAARKQAQKEYELALQLWQKRQADLRMATAAQADSTAGATAQGKLASIRAKGLETADFALRLWPTSMSLPGGKARTMTPVSLSGHEVSDTNTQTHSDNLPPPTGQPLNRSLAAMADASTATANVSLAAFKGTATAAKRLWAGSWSATASPEPVSDHDRGNTIVDSNNTTTAASPASQQPSQSEGVSAPSTNCPHSDSNSAGEVPPEHSSAVADVKTSASMEGSQPAGDVPSDFTRHFSTEHVEIPADRVHSVPASADPTPESDPEPTLHLPKRTSAKEFTSFDLACWPSQDGSLVPARVHMIMYARTMILLVTQEADLPDQHATTQAWDTLRNEVYGTLQELAFQAESYTERASSEVVSASGRPEEQKRENDNLRPSSYPQVAPLAAHGLAHDAATGQVWGLRPMTPATTTVQTSHVSTTVSKRTRHKHAAAEGLAARHTHLFRLSPSVEEVTSRTFAPLTWVRSWRSKAWEPGHATIHAVVPESRLGMHAAEQLSCDTLAIP